MLNFISTAHASQISAQTSDMFMSFMPIIAIFVIFYFLMIRPQQKRMKEHKAMVDAIKIGDHVLTSGGITGVVSKIIDANEIKVTIAPQVDVIIVRSALTQVSSKQVNQAQTAKVHKPKLLSEASHQSDVTLEAPADDHEKLTMPDLSVKNSKSKMIKVSTQTKFNALKKKTK